MSKILQIIQAKPNPAGKDKTGNYPKPEQLLGEWVDIKNVGTEEILFSTISLFHMLYDHNCRILSHNPEIYWTGGNDHLKPNQVVRVRTGKYDDRHLINSSDNTGNDWNAFANRDNFVLNNKCGDTITVTWVNNLNQYQSDAASYEANQPEGAILRRNGNRLVQVVGFGYR